MPPKTAAGKERALANLVQNRALRIVSGAFGVVPADAIEAKRREVEALLTGEAGGWLRHSDKVAVTLLARVLARLESIDGTEAIDRWLRRQATSSRPAMTVPAFVKVYLQFITQAHKLCDSLGLSPVSRNRLGVAAAQGFDLARALADLSIDSETMKGDPPAQDA